MLGSVGVEKLRQLYTILYKYIAKEGKHFTFDWTIVTKTNKKHLIAMAMIYIANMIDSMQVLNIRFLYKAKVRLFFSLTIQILEAKRKK